MGRPDSFRFRVATCGFKDVIVSDDSPARQLQKKTMSSQIKAFGPGLQRIEEVTFNVVNATIAKLAKENNNKPINFHTEIDNISIYIS